MSNRASPTVRRKRLAAELRDLRHAAGMTIEDVADRLGWQTSKVSRIENARSSVHHGDVRDLLDVYGVTDEEIREALVRIAREARKRGWWTQYRDVLIEPYVGLEDEASMLRTFELSFIPGLLQTEHYARAVISGGGRVKDRNELERRVAMRMERQKALDRGDGPRVWVVLDEPVIRRPIGGHELMAEQLRYLVSVSERDTATIQVLKFDVGAHPGMRGPFVILGFSDPLDQPVVYLETATDGLYLERRDEIERYNLLWEHLSAAALSIGDSRALLRAVAADHDEGR